MALPRNEYGLTPPQEVFAKCLAEGMTQADAYRAAYPTCSTWKESSIWSNASTLAKNVLVARRVEGIREPELQRAKAHSDYNLETAMNEAMQAFEVAKRLGQGGSMVAAAALRAKLKGYMIDRKETGEAGDFAKMDANRKQAAMQALEEELQRRARLGISASPPDVQDVDPK